jgi:hypothetical protein
MVHIKRNVPRTSMWDPPEGSWTKYPVLSLAHMCNAPLIFSLLVAHIRKYAPLITCGPHVSPTGPTSVRVMRGAYWICATDRPSINGAYSICATHIWRVRPSEKVADLLVAHFSQYMRLISSPRSTSWQPHHHFILLHWYVSNVSIIFDTPCLFTHHLLCVLLYFVAFLCIFRN